MDGQHMVRGQLALRAMGVQGIPVVNVENACASASTALHMAVQHVRSGAADIVLFDAQASTVAGEQWYSKGSNCPFIGHCLPGAVRYTLVDGHISYQS